MELGIEARTPHQAREHPGRVGAITPHFAAQDSRKPFSGINGASSTRFRSRYQVLTRADLDRYLGDHAQHFRNNFHTHFPHNVVPSREVWSELQSWG